MDVFNQALRNPLPPRKKEESTGGDSPKASDEVVLPKYTSHDESLPDDDVRRKKNLRRKHRNSHLGCGTCKKRRIKCDESLPQCSNCVKGKLHCAYLNLDAPARNALRMAQFNQSLRHDKEELQKPPDQPEPYLPPGQASQFYPIYMQAPPPNQPPPDTAPMVAQQLVGAPYGPVVHYPVAYQQVQVMNPIMGTGPVAPVSLMGSVVPPMMQPVVFADGSVPVGTPMSGAVPMAMDGQAVYMIPIRGPEMAANSDIRPDSEREREQKFPPVMTGNFAGVLSLSLERMSNPPSYRNSPLMPMIEPKNELILREQALIQEPLMLGPTFDEQNAEGRSYKTGDKDKVPTILKMLL